MSASVCASQTAPWLTVAEGAPTGRALTDFLQRLCFQPAPTLWPDQSEDGCFALLEAARYPDLPEVLEASGLEHACLFKRQAYEELRDVAPFLVRLEPEHLFTRRLLTPASEDAPHWQRWGRGVALIRSDQGLEELLRHFRKYTRIFDPSQKRWTYFRFYAPETLRSLIAHMQPPAFETFSRPFRFLLTEGCGAEPVLLGADRARLCAFIDKCRPPC